MKGHRVKFQPVTLFGKLVGASLFLACPLTWAEPATTSLSGTATIQLKNSDSPQNLSGMDLAIAPPSLIPEIRRLRMETWRTDGLAIQRKPDGEEQPVGIKIDFSDGYKNLDLKALSQAAANTATARTRTETNGTFTFTNLPPGPHALYAQYKSRYAVAYWLLEVNLVPGKTNQLDLSQANAAEIFNRFD
ncbi:MAG: carboxypeptidase regulatory-like domain-containing protein, partial [Verrucomicrobia bacterium]|nr:carboxypeptidase regulatory-like domain-containing protein [Verrucomicrobiota bacterium]